MEKAKEHPQIFQMKAIILLLITDPVSDSVDFKNVKERGSCKDRVLVCFHPML